MGTPCLKNLGERTSPCTASPEEKEEIKGYITVGVAAHVVFEDALAKETRLREEAMALKDQWETEEGKKIVGAWKDAEKNRQDSENVMRSNFKLAVEKTQAYYGIASEHKRIANGPMKGEGAKSNPEFLHFPKDKSGNYKKLYSEMERSDGKKRYSSTGGANPNSADAMTDFDGKVSVFITAFNKAQKNPGVLASILHHEAVHIGHLTDAGWVSHEGEEERTYTVSVAAADIFELTTDEGQAYKNKRAEYAEKIRLAKAHPKEIKHSLHSSFPGPKMEEGYRKEFGIEQAALDQIKQDRDALIAQVEKSKRERQEAAEREVLKKRIADYRQKVLFYGFEPILNHNGFVTGFRSPDRCDYDYTSGMSLEDAKTPLFLAAICLYRGIDPKLEPELAQTIGVINNRWSEPDFPIQMELETTSGPQEDCLRHLHENMKIPVDLKSLNKTVDKYWKDWDKGALKRLKDYEREKRRQADALRREAAEAARRRRQENRPEREEREDRNRGESNNGPCGNGGSVCNGNGPRFP